LNLTKKKIFLIAGLWLISLAVVGGLSWCNHSQQPAPKYAQGDGLEPLLPPAFAAAERCRKLLNLNDIKQPIDPTNFGERRSQDLAGKPVPNQPALIVFHETVLPLGETLKLFATTHQNDSQQVSYHLILARDGSLYRLVDDQKRAFGAGWSAWGDSSIRHRGNKTPLAGGSINNVALHISLVSPADGTGNGDGHSGYTDEQYLQLAKQVLIWQLRWGIPMRRITTHAALDRSHSRSDPRSFRWHLFDRAWQDMAKQCKIPSTYGLDAR
jgi:hypothetical protein